MPRKKAPRTWGYQVRKAWNKEDPQIHHRHHPSTRRGEAPQGDEEDHGEEDDPRAKKTTAKKTTAKKTATKKPRKATKGRQQGQGVKRGSK